MEEILASLEQFLVQMAGRVLVVVLVALVLVGIYLVVVWIIGHLARRAATVPLPGGREESPEDAAIRDAVRRRRLDTLVLVATRLAKATLVALIAMTAVTTLAPEVSAAWERSAWRSERPSVPPWASVPSSWSATT